MDVEENRSQSQQRFIIEGMYHQSLGGQSVQPVAASFGNERAVMAARAKPLNDPRSTANLAAQQWQLTAVQSAGSRQPPQHRQSGQLLQHGVAYGADPQKRVMSPNALAGFPRELCQVCQQSLSGPLVVCACCGNAVHGQCAVALGHDVYCERCITRWQYEEDQRVQREQAAHTMGMLTARGSEMLGTALGAASAASVAAGRSLMAGAAAGARFAWAGGSPMPQPVGLEVRVPRPSYLPPPLALEASNAVSYTHLTLPTILRV